MNDWDPKANEIFLRAVEHDSRKAQQAFLDKACSGDMELHANVESLLEADRQAHSFLERPAGDVAATIGLPAIIAERPGTQIGPYKLIEEIGEGGMGIVYRARQDEPVRRTVALKIIKPGMDTSDVVARFEAERQSIAMMDHPNIAKVFDAGATDAGRPYFVMELVEGKPLTEYCDRAQLSTRDRLALFVTLCHGVQHAHQKGIIHRDIKPSNILVTLHDGVPVPKIIDFGLAKAIGQQLTERLLVTVFDQMVGTPLYMSPEQAGQSNKDVDTRSDIYSLGVLLYELLTGSTPFEKDTLRTAGFDEMRRIIREVEPPRPSARVSTLVAADLSTISGRRHVDPRKLSHQLRGDLDWIVMKALEKDRDRRYASVSALAADVQRYLDNEPVQARPPSLGHHAAKWVRRHRPLVWSSAAVLTVSVVAGAILFGTSYRRTTLLERDAGEHLAAATAFLGSGNYTAADRELADARGHLEAVGNDAGPLAEKVSALTAAIAAKSRSIENFEQFQNLRHRIHSEMYALDRDILDQAQQHCRVALDLFGVFEAEPWKSQADCKNLDPAQQAILDEGAVELLFISARLEMGKSDTQPSAERTAGYRRAIEVLGKIEKSHPSIPAVALWMADCWEAIGDTQAAAVAHARAESLQATSATDYYLLGEYHAQHGQQDQALANYWQALARQPDHYLSLLAAGVTLGELKKYESAETMLTGAIAMNPHTVIAYVQRAAARREQSKIVLAMADVEEAKQRDPELALALLRRAGEFREHFQLDKALVDYSDAIRLDPQATAYFGRGITYAFQGDLEKALADCNEFIRLAPESAGAFAVRAEIYRLQGDMVRALADANESLRLDPKYAWAYLYRGRIHDHQREWAKALADMNEAVRLSPQDAGLLVGRADVYRAMGERQKALADYEEAMRLDPKNVWGYFGLSALHSENGDFDKALDASNEAIRIAPQYPLTFASRAALHRARGDFEKALADYSEAIRLGPKAAEAYVERAGTYAAKGDSEKALADYSEAIRVAPHSALPYVTRAAFRRERGEFDGALADINEALRLEPANASLLASQSEILLERGEPEKALAAFDEAIRLHPNDVSLYVARANFHNGRGNLDKALADSNEAIRLAPNSVSAYVSRADTYRAMGQLDKGLADMNEAIRLGSTFPAGEYGHRGHFHRDRGDFDKALADYSEAIRLSPRFLEAYLVRAELYESMGQFDRAAADYDRAVELAQPAPLSWHRYKRCALAHFRLKHYDQALESIAKAVELNPGDGSNLLWVPPAEVAKCPDEHLRQGLLDLADEAIEKTKGAAETYAARAMLYEACGRREEARTDFDKALQLEPTNAVWWDWRTLIHGQLERWDEVIVDLSKYIELKPEPLQVRCLLALAQLGAGRLDEYRQNCAEILDRRAQTPDAGEAFWTAWACALGPDAVTDWPRTIALAELAVASDPKSTTFLNALGAILYRAGRLEEAVQQLAQADQLMPEPSELQRSSPAYTWFFLAMTHHRLGHAEEAKPWLDKAVAWTDKILAEADQGTTDLPWNRRLTLKLLRDEATTLLGVTPPAVEPAPKPGAKVEEVEELTESTPAPESAKEEEKSK